LDKGLERVQKPSDGPGSNLLLPRGGCCPIVGISKSGFGSGIGVLGVPLMALVIPPQQAAAIMLRCA